MKKITLISASFILASSTFAQTLQDAITKTDNERYAAAASDFRSLIAKEANKGDNYFYYGENFFKKGDSVICAFLGNDNQDMIVVGRMNIAIDVLAQQGIKPIALIHDAFIVRNKLSASRRDEIHQALRSSTQNKFWFIKQTELEGYRYQ